MLNNLTERRNEFGALIALPETFGAVAAKLLALAIESAKLPPPYFDMQRHKRHGYLGWCLNYDFYDVTPSTVLVQRRETEKTKFGVTPHKDYFLVRRCGRGVIVKTAPKAIVVKLAKASDHLGQVIKTISARERKDRECRAKSTLPPPAA